MDLADLGKNVVLVQVGVIFVSDLDVGMTHHAAQELGLNTAFGGQCGEGVTAGVGCHFRTAELLHQIVEIPFAEIGGVLIALVAVDEAGTDFGSGGGQKRSVGCQPNGRDGDYTVCAGIGLGAADKIIIIALIQRYLEQLVDQG